MLFEVVHGKKYKGSSLTGAVALAVRIDRSESKVFQFLLCFLNIAVHWDSENKWFRVLIKHKKDFHRAMLAVDAIAHDIPKYVCPILYQRI